MSFIYQNVVNTQRDLNRAHSDGHFHPLPLEQLFGSLEPVRGGEMVAGKSLGPGDADRKRKRARFEIHSRQSIEIFTCVWDVSLAAVWEKEMKYSQQSLLDFVNLNTFDHPALAPSAVIAKVTVYSAGSVTPVAAT